MYKVASLFSGCGGLDLAFKWEGFNLIWANEINPYACETHKLNFPETLLHEGDIADVNPDTIPNIDVVIGGFPCQDFSMLWKRGGINTDRGNLYNYFVKIVREKMPKIFLAENVKGLLTANKGQAIHQIITDFSSVGYNITIEKVNFANYGAPQLRERIFLIGIRKDIDYSFLKPKITHEESNYVTSKEALYDVEKVLFNNEHQKIAKKTIEMLKLIPAGGNFTSIPPSSPYYVKGMISHVYRRLDPDKPSTTIIAAGGGGTWGYHYAEPRPLTNRERARLFGYPDDFIFKGSITEVRRQIGNSVPPVGAQPFARAIKEVLNKI
jgi:DNA (cytosine-5)-methyltransferase 1